MTPKGDRDDKLARLRAQLPAVTATGYFNAGTNGPVPLPAQEALLCATAQELERGRIMPGLYEGSGERNARVRELVAGIVNVDPPEIALTHSTSEGLSAVLNGLHWRRGDEIVTTNLEHPGLLAPLGLLAHRFGVVIRNADIGCGSAGVAEAIAAAFTPRTRVVALSHVMWSTGAVISLREVSEVAHRRGIMVVVDAAQAAGHIPVDLHALEVDAYAMAGQKWLCGPDGTGALYVHRDRIGEIQPTFLRYAQIDPYGYVLPAPGAMRYEVGEFYGPAIAAQQAALAWFRDDVGPAWAYERTATLGRRCRDGLAALPGVEVITPEEKMAGLVAFSAQGVTPTRMAEAVYDRGHTIRPVDYPPGRSAARISTAWWATEQEVDALVADIGEVASLAAAGPDAGPGRS